MTSEEELRLMLENGDCPAELLDLMEESQSKWRKGVVKEFILDHIWRKEIEGKLKRLSLENKGIIALLVTLIGLALKIQLFGA